MCFEHVFPPKLFEVGIASLKVYTSTPSYLDVEIVSLAIGIYIRWKDFKKHDSIFIRNFYFKRTLNNEHRLDLLKPMIYNGLFIGSF